MLNKRDSAISNVTSIPRNTTHDCDIETPANIEYAKRLNTKNSNNSWIKVIEKEMHAIGISFEVLEDN